jgi:hypothetical protein
MKKSVMVWLVAVTVLEGGPAISGASDSQAQTPAFANPKAGGAGDYDDRQIRRIKRGETTETQLLEWFGPPETREVSPDGRGQLGWGWNKAGTAGGAFRANISPEGRVEAYSARQNPLLQKQTVEFVAESEADMRKQMDQWRREGWSVHSISQPIPQADGTVKRKADLSRNEEATVPVVAYDDRRIAAIRRGKTTEAQLFDWFGPAYSRDLQPDGRMKLVWRFGASKAGSGNSGELKASVARNGTVDSYTAHRGP